MQSPLASESVLPKYKDVTEWIDGTLKLIFGDHVPTWISPAVGIALAIALFLVTLWGALYVTSKIKELWVQKFQPLFYKPEARRSAERRRRFAEHVKARLTVLNSREAWQDYKFTELEAEVEAEGSRGGWLSILQLSSNRSDLRRERSLSAALRSSKERLILVEGDPGAGKSIALRHVANVLVERAMKARSKRSLIPLYINLKELKRPRKAEINRNLIEDFVINTLRANDRDVEEYLGEEFKEGLQNGTWLFLFDSFDELPDVLSSTEADETIRIYSEAIHDFLHGMNRCRGIVASRYFRGPGGLAWPRFRIQPLSQQRRVRLIKRVNLDSGTEGKFLTWLESVGQEFQLMLSNPMFLGLLCNHVKTDNPLPSNPHAVFETYVESRFKRDTNRLLERFGFVPEELRLISEQVAFCMAAEDGLGLNPTRNRLRGSVQRQQFTIGKRFEAGLDALEFMKLARSEAVTEPGESQIFTFAHRRFQEYFATRMLLREPLRVDTRQLLRNARWRESAVVLFQTQPISKLLPQIKEVRVLLEQMYLAVSGQVPESRPTTILWPRATLHLCGIVQDGFGGRLDELPGDIRGQIGGLVSYALHNGMLLDKKWALEVAGAARSRELSEFIRRSFSGDSQMLKDVAYWQVGRLREIPQDIVLSIYKTLVRMAAMGQLRQQRQAIHAHISRLSQPQQYLRALRLLEWVPSVNFALNAVALALVITFSLPMHRYSRLLMIGAPSIIACLNVSIVWLDWKWIGMMRMQLVFYMITLCFILRGRKWWLGVALLYALLWGPTAVKAATEGKWTSRVVWPFMPMRPVVVAIGHWDRHVKKLISQWKDVLKGVGLFALGASLIGGLLWLSTKFYAAKVAAGGIGVVGIVFTIYAISKDSAVASVRYLGDMLRFRRLLKSDEAFDVASVKEGLSWFVTDNFKARFIRALRQRSLLAASVTVLAQVEQISTSFERTTVAAATSDVYHAAFLDELWLLVEQLQKQIPQSSGNEVL